MKNNRPFKGSCRKEQRKARKNRAMGSEYSAGRTMVMDWTKFKTNHVLVTYRDMPPKVCLSWIRFMALIANIEKEPTNKQILQHMTKNEYKTMKNYFKTYEVTLENIQNKVIEDVEIYKKDKERNKIKSKSYRESMKQKEETSPGTSPGTSPLRHRLDKIRLDKSIINTTPISPEGDKVQPSKYSEDFLSFWEAYPASPNKTAKASAFKAWMKAKGRPDIDTLKAALAKVARSEKWTKNNGQFIPNPAKWINGACWEDDAGGQKQATLTELEKYCEVI